MAAHRPGSASSRPWLFDLLRARYEDVREIEAYTRQIERGLLAEEKAVMEAVCPPPGTVLALGCGAGREVFGLHAMGYRVTGVDISQGMLAVARAEAAKRLADPSAVSWLWMRDPLRIPVPSGSFTCVVAFAQVFSHIPNHSDRIRLLAEVRRALIPGGLLMASITDRNAASDLLTQEDEAGAESVAGEGAAARENLSEAHASELERAAGCEDGDLMVWGTSDAEIDEPLFFHLHTPEEIESELAAAGLTLEAIRFPAELTPTPAPDGHRYPFVVARRA